MAVDDRVGGQHLQGARHGRIVGGDRDAGDEQDESEEAADHLTSGGPQVYAGPRSVDGTRASHNRTPRIDALSRPLTQRRIDLGAVAQGYEAMGQPTPASPSINKASALLVFVSFSMPELALGRLVDQAARSGATLVLRGFVDGSLQQTVARTQRLIGQRQVGFQIDPQAFDRFSVAVTPTFVLIKDGAAPEPCAAGTCYPASAFVSASGDVSVDYALEYFKRASPAFSREAGAYLSKLRGR